MRTQSLIIILLFVTNPFFAQIPSNVVSIEDAAFNAYFLNRNNIPKVKGKIINLAKAGINKAKVNYAITTPVEQMHVEKSCTLNTDGYFELKL